ncbi:hypothetical protein Ddc_14478 [Ditylenchus destructor]|nr:hypothetical protein Ddc_14478 [Ditylenchus destructor]
MLQQHRCQRQSHCSKFTGVHMKLMRQLSLSLVGFLMAVECFSVILCADEPIEYPVFVQVQSTKYHYNLVGYDVLGHETVKDFLYSLKAHLNSDKEEDADEQVYYPGTDVKVEIDLEKSRTIPIHYKLKQGETVHNIADGND